MLSQVLDAKGLITYVNTLGTQAPAGALAVANNVNCNTTGTIEGRRGFEFYSDQQFDVTNGYITKLFSYESTLYASYNAGQFAQDNGAGVWTTYGSGFKMLPPIDGFLHQMLAGGNSYFTTNNGVYKLSGVNANPPVQAGSPSALDTTTVVSGTVSTGFLYASSNCAYEIVWGYVDQSNLEILGAPSYAAYAANTQSVGASNNANVTITFSIPPFVEQSQQLPWFYQIYRTPNTGTGLVSALAVPPGNNFQLVVQASPTSTNYTNHYVTYADTTLDSLLGADLYTDDGQPTVGQPFGQPPLCYDIAYFSSMAFYANFTTLQDAFLTLDAVGASLGLQVGDTITITDSTTSTSYTYTGISGANNPTLREFNVYTGGTPAQNIQTTAQNIVSVINQDPNNFLFIIQYISGFSDLPGQMQLFAQNLSQGTFSIISSRTTCWSPAVPSSGVGYISSAVSEPNGLYVSEVGEPESVPPSFTFFVGSPNFPIERIIAVRTSLIVIKGGEEGIYQIQGTSPTTLQATLLDTTAFIRGSETLAALNNAGYFFTTQGAMLVNESGCEIMSRNVQGDILALSSYQYPNFDQLAFGVGYQSDNCFLLFMQSSAADLVSTLQYRYNWITEAWTTWDKPCTAAIVNPANDRLYWATPAGFILEERKTFTSQDAADETIVVNITNISGSTFTLTDSANTNVGDQISQVNGGTTFTAFILTNDTITGVITVDTPSGFITGNANDTAAIAYSLTYLPVSGGYPGFIKKFNTWNFDFEVASFNQCKVSFTSNFYPTAENVTLVPISSGTWGTFGWGTIGWGVGTTQTQAISTYSTKNTSVANWINVSLSLQQAFQTFNLAGLVVFYDFLGSRFR